MAVAGPLRQVLPRYTRASVPSAPSGVALLILASRRSRPPRWMVILGITGPPSLRGSPTLGGAGAGGLWGLGDRRGKGQSLASPLEGQPDTAAPAGRRERRAAMGRR